MADPKPELPIEERSFRKSYLIFAGLLAATTLWAAVDETLVRRPWKNFQAEFNHLEEVQVQNAIDSLHKVLATEDAGLPADETIAGMEARAQSLRDAQNASEVKDKRHQLTKTDDELFGQERQFQFAKALYEEVYYEWKEKEYAGHDYASGKAEWEELGAKMAALQPVITDLTHRRDALKKELDSAAAELKTVEDKLETRLTPVHELERRLKNVRGRSLQIKQVLLRDFEPNEWGQPIMRVDRCETCHLGINRDGFEDWPQPYTTHPKRADLFGKHNPEKFGCTGCHDGQGPALTVEDAHYGQEHHFDFPMLAGADIDAGCQKCHFNRVELGKFMSAEEIEDKEIPPAKVPYHPTKLLVGQRMIRDNQCYACHEIAGFEGLPKKAPQLNALSKKTTPEWTYDWLKDPWRFRPTTKMPNFMLPDSEAAAITAFLFRLAKSSDYEHPEKNVPSGNASKGGMLMAEVGCYGCHATAGMYAPGDPALAKIANETTPNRWRHGPDLTKIGSKTDAVWIYNWIRNPRHYWTGSRMPDLRLTETEAADVTAFLLTHHEDISARAKVPAGFDLASDALAKQGETWVRTYGCYGCHDIKGFESAGKVSVSLSEFGTKKPEELAFGDATTEIDHTWLAWTKGKLENSRRYATEAIVQRMPNFNLSEGEADTIALVLRSWDGRRVFEDFSEPVNKWMANRQKGRLVTEFYNCAGCHVLEGQRGDIRGVIGSVGFSPPNLNTEGRKVQSDWLYKFLSGPTPIRPWLKVRMPTFHFSDSNKTAVVDYFQALEEYDQSYDYVDVNTYPQAKLAEGKKTFDDLKCLSCHVLESKASYTPAEAATLAPNLRMAHDRLRPEWVIDWLRDPQVIDPGTRMPSYFYSEGVRLYEDAEEKMEALRDHIMSLGAPKP